MDDLRGTELLETNPSVSRFHKPIEYLPYGAAVTTEEKSDNYYLVKYGAKTGWLHKGDLNTSLTIYTRYINSLPDVPLLEKPEPNAKKQKILKNNTQVRLLSSHKEDFRKYDTPIWLKVSMENSEGWIRFESLGAKPIDYFFYVRSFNGLNLRKEASVTSIVMQIIPYKGSGKILERLPADIYIQGQLGYWMKVEVNGTSGWLFSGFTLVGTDLDSMKNSLDLHSEDAFKNFLDKQETVPSMTVAQYKEFARGYKVRETNLDDYTVLELTIPYKDECDQKRADRVAFHNKASDTYFMVDEGKVNMKVSINYPLKNTVSLSKAMCWCCCPWINDETYFLGRKSVKRLGLYAKKIEGVGVCYASNVSGIDWGQIFRKQSEYSLLAKIYFPDCALTGDNVPKTSSPGDSLYLKGKNARHTLAFRLAFDPEKETFEVSKEYDKPLSADFEKNWADAGQDINIP